MCSSKNNGRFLFWIAFLFCGISLGFVVNQLHRHRSATVIPSVAEGSQRKDGDRDNARRRLQQIYNSQIGVREKTGKNDGPQVEKYLAYTGIKTPSAWCAAFVSWTFHQAGLDVPKTAWSPALFPDNRLTSSPKTGDVFGIYFQELKRIAHCGFVDEWDGTWCITVEGNTNDVNSVTSTDDSGNPIRAGPGEGVYRKKRLIKTIYKVADWVSALNN